MPIYYNFGTNKKNGQATFIPIRINKLREFIK